MPNESQIRYVIGEFELEPATHRLLRNGDAIHLTNKPFKILNYLIAHRDRIVSRTELLEQFWDGHLVYEETLTKSVGAIRKALSDSAESPRFIETHWAEGYRFIGDVEEQVQTIEISQSLQIVVEEDDGQDSENLEAKKPIRQTLSKSPVMVLVVIAIVPILAFGYWAFVLRQESSAARPVRSIAVLPLKNLGGQTEDEFLVDGITDSLISSLSQLDGMRVISRGSAYFYKDKEIDPTEVGQRLGVEAVLIGSARRNGDFVDLELALHQASDGAKLLVKKFQGTVSEPLNDRTIFQITSILGAPNAKRAVGRRESRNPEVNELYLKGRFFWNKRNPQDLEKSVGYFEQAIAKDPEYAPAYAALANSYQLMSEYRSIPVADGFAKARIAANKALELDPSLAEAHTALAYIQAFYDWDFANADESFKRAMVLNPNYATAHQWYSELMTVYGRWAEAETAIRRARECDPLSLIVVSDTAAVYYMTRQYDKSIDEAKKILEMDPNFLWAHLYLWANYDRKGLEHQAAEEYSQLVRMTEGSETADELLAALKRSGTKGFWRKYVEHTNDPKRARYSLAWDRVVAYLRLGDPDQTFHWLEKSYEQRERWVINIKYDPQFDSVRSDPRFESMLRRTGLL